MPIRVVDPGTTEVHRRFDVKKNEKPLPVGDAETTSWRKGPLPPASPILNFLVKQ